jgi:hypothetical protein
MEYLKNLDDAMSNIAGIDPDAISEIKGQLASGGMVDLTLMSPEQIN